MGRSPCCDKTGLKKGAWTPEEDRKLTAYIKRYGSWNWRELPKYAGLSRCGKSCRLRWMNYLRPDIKRGNYTNEEERIIMESHEFLGNRWSMIAAKLPGRTDNEIKNHWHTNLKKRLKQNSASSEAKLQSHEISQSEEDEKMELPPTVCQILESSPLSPRPSFIEFSTPNSEPVVVGDPSRMEYDNDSAEILPEPKGDFWTEPNLAGNFYIQQDIPPTLFDPISLFPLSPISLYETFSLYETYSNDAIGC